MSIKDLFTPNGATIAEQTLESLGENAESPGNIVATQKRLNVFLPPLDYSSASNFAVYGSAEKYYEDAVKRVYTQYPYDGSEKEINEYTLSSSYLDQYVFNKRYPRTNGYAIMAADGWGTLADTSADSEYGAPPTASYEYIALSGGPHSTLSSTDSVASAFSGSYNQNNIYDPAVGQASNLASNPASGSTIEFWLKKSEWLPSLTTREVIFDLWNDTDSSDVSYGRVRIEAKNANPPFLVTYRSGSRGFSEQSLGALTAADLIDGNWHHYAISFISSSVGGGSLRAKLYVDGELDDTRITASSISEVTGALLATVGSLKTAVATTTGTGIGWGKLSASLDEFRYWKKERTAEQIGKHWWSQVRGGTNSDLANIDLGVYYKFNEGIVANSAIDSTVLDYSGRISNGAWTGYTTNSRNTGSAMVLSKASPSEFKDPIIHTDHPLVSALLTDLKASGSAYDQGNNSSIMNSLPAWISESDDSGDLNNLVQIIASYFDRLQNEIRELPRLKNVAYLSSSYVPAAFSSELVKNTGLFASEIFIDASVVEQILSRDDDRPFAMDLEEIRNRIYQNIYNNLVYINKSKGTEKSFRNLIHCYGVGEDLIRLNLYGNNVDYEIRENFRSTVVAKNLADFNAIDNNGATIFQMTASGNSNSVSYISGTAGSIHVGGEDFAGFTLESEVIFPRRPDICDVTGSVGTPFISASLFGMHGALGTDAADTTWPTTDYADLRVLAVRPYVDAAADDAKFELVSSVAGIPTLTTDLFKDVYDNNKWNFAVRLKNNKYPLGDTVSGVSGSDYTLEFYGVNQLLDITREEFLVTGSVTAADAANLLQSNKRVFGGAHRTNFTGSLLQSSDIKLSTIKYWARYLENGAIKAHARDTENYGTLRPHENAFLTQTALTGTYIPQIATLALDWNFYNLTGSNADGELSVSDSSSGSVASQTTYGWLGNIVNAQHTGKGAFFPLPALDLWKGTIFIRLGRPVPNMFKHLK